MRKIQFFIFVEAMLLTMAVISILAESFSRFILLAVLVLLLIYYYFGKQRGNFLLVTASILFFLIIIGNPYVIASLLFAVVYGLIVASPYFYKENKETILIFNQDVEANQERNRWLGDLHHFHRDFCQFEDINLHRFYGKDTIHLENVIISNHDNVILVRKFFGDTKIVVPVDIAISLQANSLYGDLYFMDEEHHKLRNESISLTSSDYQKANRSVKIVLSTLVGSIEVVRK
ncbi:Transporter associated with VraSR [Streptococcus sp. DD10]|uniref:cell wall-active antibiotics response protein LiaF n=1 Tax=Streptococcus sp. DD10 TaxID=1777878 RepID=UPI000797C4BB|nr:cell wall-active antibiotics response protein LiaF [Streptococcus sp. DD10]KXT73743.1 Transporter associated with VraSR [Streptococcus sp. DD10]